MNNAEVFYWDGKPGTAPGTEPDEYLVWDCDAGEPMPGWYCVDSDETYGPFATEQDARSHQVSVQS